MQHTLTLKTDHVAYAHCCSLMARAAARRAAARAAARATAARAAAGRPAASRLVAQTTARGRRLEPRWATARQADARRATARAAARATTGRGALTMRRRRGVAGGAFAHCWHRTRWLYGWATKLAATKLAATRLAAKRSSGEERTPPARPRRAGGDRQARQWGDLPALPWRARTYR